MSFAPKPTPFHIRTAGHNFMNAWVRRGAFTVPAHYGNAVQEALRARVSAVMIDVTAYEDLHIHGRGAASLLEAASGAGIRALCAGRSAAVHWCADRGGLRGYGRVLCVDEDKFVLRSDDADLAWFMSAAPRFRADVAEVTPERGLLYLAGPFAAPILETAGLDGASRLEPDQHDVRDSSGISITLSRNPQLGGFVISCGVDHGVAVFDRLFHAGQGFGLRLAGQEALEILQLEAGLVLPHHDFTPAREPFAREPIPSSLGIGGGEDRASRILAGIEFDSAEPCPFAKLFQGSLEVGRTLRSIYSGALGRAIALAQIPTAHAAIGTMLDVQRFDDGRIAYVPGRVVRLPFL